MLVFRIISTIILGIFCLFDLIINCGIFSDSRYFLRDVLFSTLIGWSLAAFVIVSLWII